MNQYATAFVSDMSAVLIPARVKCLNPSFDILPHCLNPLLSFLMN